jgi:hypothetical protein
MDKFYFDKGKVGDRVTICNDQQGKIISMDAYTSHPIIVQFDDGEIGHFNYYGFNQYSNRLWLDDTRKPWVDDNPMVTVISNQRFRIDWLEAEMEYLLRIMKRATEITDAVLMEEEGVN